MMTFELKCVNCKKPFKVEMLEPPESRYARCPDCGAPHWLEVKQKTIVDPGRFAHIPGMRQ
jgi:DNA-directed RNA polymerase subunit RPC12/RpoP